MKMKQNEKERKQNKSEDDGSSRSGVVMRFLQTRRPIFRVRFSRFQSRSHQNFLFAAGPNACAAGLSTVRFLNLFQVAAKIDCRLHQLRSIGCMIKTLLYEMEVGYMLHIIMRLTSTTPRQSPDAREQSPEPRETRHQRQQRFGSAGLNDGCCLRSAWLTVVVEVFLAAWANLCAVLAPSPTIVHASSPLLSQPEKITHVLLNDSRGTDNSYH